MKPRRRERWRRDKIGRLGIMEEVSSSGEVAFLIESECIFHLLLAQKCFSSHATEQNTSGCLGSLLKCLSLTKSPFLLLIQPALTVPRRRGEKKGSLIGYAFFKMEDFFPRIPPFCRQELLPSGHTRDKGGFYSQGDLNARGKRKGRSLRKDVIRSVRLLMNTSSSSSGTRNNRNRKLRLIPSHGPLPMALFLYIY